MIENKAIEGEVHVRIGLAHRAHHQILDQLRKPEHLGQRHEPGAALEFHLSNRPIVNLSEIILPLRAQVGLVEIENERNGQDRDDNHELDERKSPLVSH